MKDVNLLLQNGVNIEKSLELFGDMETYDETLTDFSSDIDEKLKNLKSFKEVADMSNYAILVHSLKSDAKYFGFEKLADLCYQHEMESKSNNIYFVYDHFEELMEEMTKVLKIVREYLGEEVVEQPLPPSVKPKSGKKILVVDDSNVIQKFVEKLFQEKYQVLIAQDGKEALDIITGDDASSIVAMLLDLNMPNVNGFAVLQYFYHHNLFDRIPVSIITGVGNEDVVKQAFQYPIVDVLRKPFNERDIKLVVDKTLQQKQAV